MMIRDGDDDDDAFLLQTERKNIDGFEMAHVRCETETAYDPTEIIVKIHEIT